MSYPSAAVTNIITTDNLKKGDLVWASISRVRIHDGSGEMAADGLSRELRDHTFNRKHKAEKERQRQRQRETGSRARL